MTLLSCCCNFELINAKAIHSSYIDVSTPTSRSLHSVAFVIPRGGYDDESSYESDEEEYDDEEEEEVVKLSKATVEASTKANAKQTKETKKAVSKSLSTSAKKKKSKDAKAKVAETKSKSKSRIRIPYILKAFLNPFTVFAMTKGYFASLFNIDYLQQDTSQTLRSALEEKAKRSGGNTSKRPGRGRKMKPGQAKTLSDLPQLSA